VYITFCPTQGLQGLGKVVGLVCFNNPPSYDGGSWLLVGHTLPGRLVGEKPDKETTHRPSRIAGG